jgi:hypothetical protein
MEDYMNSFKEKCEPVRGIFKLNVFRCGKIIETLEDHNLIVDGARIQMAHLIAGDASGRKISKISFGTSGMPPAASDQAIANPFTKTLDGFTYPEEGQAGFSWSLSTAEDNGQAILEFGLVCDDGTLFARRTRTNPINKESDISLEGTWTIIF